MTATMVTPEIVRVGFLRRIGRSLRFSLGSSEAIISGLEGMRSRWCLAAIWVLIRLMSVWVGEGRSISASIISRTGVFALNVHLPY